MEGRSLAGARDDSPVSGHWEEEGRAGIVRSSLLLPFLKKGDCHSERNEESPHAEQETIEIPDLSVVSGKSTVAKRNEESPHAEQETIEIPDLSVVSGKSTVAKRNEESYNN